MARALPATPLPGTLLPGTLLPGTLLPGTLLLGTLLLGAAGCRGLGFAPAGTTLGAHMVTQARAGCAVVAARTFAEGGHALLTFPEAAAPPQPGDLFEGPVRVGPSVFRFVPADGMDAWRNGEDVPAEVLAAGLSAEEARAAMDARCGPLPPLPPRRASRR
ncbi:MAG: hypothetical protein ACK41D_11360 [Rubricoccaceae bacterium]